nr:sigma-70 family RNA polymerase sigma factor [Acidobacteriota bacterium]
MSQLLNTKTDLKSHAEHFVERYERLLGWALHLTDHDRAQAEDLLHDAFIQFTLAAPDLDDIRNLDNYLFGVLRILRVSQLRRASRRRFEQLSIIEYESAEIGLSMASRAAEPGELIRVRDELRAICQYACARKETSKAGSVLILRFFYGYYPSEIAAVLRSTRKVVDMRLQSARREARLYCSAPERLG